MIQKPAWSLGQLWPDGLSGRALADFVRVNWHLGFTAFGGPPVHFRIFHEKYVNKEKWIDEQMYQELFSICQSLCGPGSTKMLYCINLVHGGTLSAIVSFVIWSLPGAAIMYGLSLAVAKIQSALPSLVYAVLSGLNASIVGVILLSAVELSDKAITDDVTRLLVFFTAAAGILYNALWYFPVLLVVSGVATLVFDFRWLHRPVAAVVRLVTFWRRRPARVENQEELGTELQPHTSQAAASKQPESTQIPSPALASTEPLRPENEPRIIPQSLRLSIPWQAGTAIIASFLVSFTVFMVLRGVLPAPPRAYSVFANMYLAGTIIFGGGPVVIPLLREYVVSPGWVQQRDFLIGLAIIQSLPGPNFNFAVFLGSLAAASAGASSILGAFVAWLGIFLPGIVLVHGTMGVWSAIRSRRSVKSVLRGVNAGAVGLIFTAVYRIWQTGYLDEAAQQGRSLGDDPWWLVIAAVSFVFGRWYGVNIPVLILSGAVLALIRYGVVSG